MKNIVCAAAAALALSLSGNASPARAEGPAPGGRLTTHVLDVANGHPAQGVTIDFGVVENGAFRLLQTVQTNPDGRAGPLMSGDTMKAGQYELIFHVAEYYAREGTKLPDPNFLNNVPIVFTINDPKANYHVPLLVAPWSYTTYRGS